MNQQTEKYIELFNRLEEAFAKKINKNRHIPFSHMVYELSNQDMFIKRNKALLDDLCDLRNVLVHKEGNEIIAVPSDAALSRLSSIVTIYTKPISLYSIINHNVITVGSEASLAEALAIMKGNTFTKVPVYDKDEYVGLLSSRALTKWLTGVVDDQGVIHEQVKNVRVADVLRLNGRKNEVKFLPRDMTVLDFLSMHLNSRPLSGVYVMTEHGKASQKPIGIITEYDFPVIAEMVKI